jgi:hypothetical protein
MADKKISQLDLLAHTDIDLGGDFFPIVDSGATSVTKRVKAQHAGVFVKDGTNYFVNDGGLSSMEGTNCFNVGINNDFKVGSFESFSFGKLNVQSGDNSFAYGFSNTTDGTTVYSQAFGKANKIKSGNHSFTIGQSNTCASGARQIAVGFQNTTSGNDSFAFGKNVRTPSNVAEFGIWNSSNSRGAGVRCSNLGDAFNPGDGFVSFTLPNTGAQFGTSNNGEGKEPAIRLPKEMCMFRRNGTEMFVDVNDNNTIRSVSLGTATTVSNTSAGAPVQNVRADTNTITTIRQMGLSAYNDLLNASPSQVDANTVYIIVG